MIGIMPEFLGIFPMQSHVLLVERQDSLFEFFAKLFSVSVEFRLVHFVIAIFAYRMVQDSKKENVVLC